MTRTDYFCVLVGWSMGLVCGCGEDPRVQLESMPQPDLSTVAEERLLEAIGKARAAILASPDSAATWGHLGNLYYVHGWEDEAVPYYQRATELDPEEFRWPYFLGRSLRDKDPTRAADILSRALELDPGYPAAHTYRAYALRNLGRFDEARTHFQQVLALDPNNWFAHLGLGQLALATREFQAGLQHLRKALELDSKRREVHAALAQAYQAQGDREAAASHSEAARLYEKMRPMRDPLWREAERCGATLFWFSKRGQQYLREMEFEQALGEFSQIIWAGETNPVLWCDYGSSLLGVQRTEEAIAALERALTEAGRSETRNRMEPGFMLRIHNTLGQAQVQAGNLAAAAKHMQLALSFDPEAMVVVGNLARIYAYQGRAEEALELLQRTPGVQQHPQTAGLLLELQRRHAPEPTRPGP